jgi:hypothetical protein
MMCYLLITLSWLLYIGFSTDGILYHGQFRPRLAAASYPLKEAARVVVAVVVEFRGDCAS